MTEIQPTVTSPTPEPATHGRRRWTRPWALITTIGPANVLFAIVLGVAGGVLITDPQNGGNLAAAIGMQAVVLPVLLARVAPVWAAVALAAGALVNEMAFGPLVRCGVILPVMFVISYQLGAQDPSKLRNGRWVALGALIATAAMELAWDPQLDASAAILIAGLGGGFYCAGMLIRSRTKLVATLQRSTTELHEQRDRTAALEVAADRARVGADLERLIRAQIEAIGVNAERAKAAATDDPDRAQAALIDVEKSGRETLARMRDVVGNLRDAPTEPPPGLDQLSDLLRRATCSDARLTIEGPAHRLTSNVELSAYRIVEQLLMTLRDQRSARVEVTIRFTDDALEIRVCGPAIEKDSPDTTASMDHALRAARARAELHGGTVLTRNPLGRRETDVRIPLLTAAPR